MNESEIGQDIRKFNQDIELKTLEISKLIEKILKKIYLVKLK